MNDFCSPSSLFVAQNAGQQWNSEELSQRNSILLSQLTAQTSTDFFFLMIQIGRG
jgi:hypothetical protein